MTIWSIQSGRYRDEDDETQEFDRFERITHRHGGDCPVRSHDSRKRGQMRERGTARSRQKARTINGVHRRSNYRHSAVAF